MIQRRLEIARALAADPALLLLDEPAAGLHPTEVQRLIALVRRVRSLGITVLLIEHHMEVVTELADRVTVLNFGRVIADGTPEQVVTRSDVVEAYLGEEGRERPKRVAVSARREPNDAGGAIAPVLSIKALRVLYGGTRALDGVDLDVYDAEVVALIGANGAGKTTILKTVSGLSEPMKSVQGEIAFRGNRIDHLRAHDVARLGITHVPEGRRVFPESTVEENLLLGAYVRHDRDLSADINAVYERFPVLATRRHQQAGVLSGGEQQMLAFGRALTARPHVLLLDEPSHGLAPVIIDDVFGVLRDLAAERVTILLVEQLATRALALADRAYILETGRIVKTGNANELARDPEVAAAYLGG